ncbi:MAG: tryptophan--tRNA ligase [Candidatus Kerfeldbacteria bacterium]|nr:tryptophan--tRNA ligase [Candidatus Kerfeldbacteria bacterium]
MKQRILSGIQPSGVLHIGNYLGALKQWVELQETYDALFCIVDLHAITVKQDPKELRAKIRELAKLYIACGIGPKKSTIFVQSHVPAHTELGWILNTITKISELERMTQFKDKAGKNRAHVNAGLLCYPTLMAADILLYQTDLVPVGEDQTQHLELTRTLAKRFNTQFGEVFRIPEGYFPKAGARIMALDDPTVKMSKSGAPANYLALLDDEKTIRKKVARAVTDSGSEIKAAHDKPAMTNLLTITHLLSGESIADIEHRYRGKGYRELKQDLADRVVDFLAPIQQRTRNISDNEIETLLQEGAKRAREIASQTLTDVQRVLGLG